MPPKQEVQAKSRRKAQLLRGRDKKVRFQIDFLLRIGTNRQYSKEVWDG